MQTLNELVRRIKPETTLLVLGAGAGAPSGGPSGMELARLLAKKLAGAPISDDLAETGSILVNRFGRKDVIAEVRGALNPLTPTGGMLALPHLPWPEIYTTNFDRLVEKAYRTASKPIVP